jgi:hypothetical protein
MKIINKMSIFKTKLLLRNYKQNICKFWQNGNDIIKERFYRLQHKRLLFKEYIVLVYTWYWSFIIECILYVLSLN